MPDLTGKMGYLESEGVSEQVFLGQYSKTKYPRPSVTVDLVIFTIAEGNLKVLLIERKGHPFKGHWALPGGFVDVGDAFENQGEDLEEAAVRELGEETGLDQTLLKQHRVHLEQLYTFGRAYRDPRTRVIGVAYFALVSPDLLDSIRAGEDAEKAQWLSVDTKVPNLAFDHDQILAMALERVRGKLNYAPLAFSMVPAQFTLSELREVYEVVQGKGFDASNFRRRFKRMQTDGVLEELQELRVPGKLGGRPAKVYRFCRD